jgi:uncharacterized protein (DUF983 family)
MRFRRVEDPGRTSYLSAMSFLALAPKPEAQPATAVPLKTALWRGLTGHCPHCGKGRMFRAFLKVADRCNVCGEELHHQRADDFPAYLVIVLVGHLVVPLVLHVEMTYQPAYWIHAAMFLPLTLALSLLLIQPVKGAVIALQWHAGMHGFEEAKKLRASVPTPG